jgi:hypothetical protein
MATTTELEQLLADDAFWVHINQKATFDRAVGATRTAVGAFSSHTPENASFASGGAS